MIKKVSFYLLFLSLGVSFPQMVKAESERYNHIQPVSEDLLRVNGKSFYIENISVAAVSESRIQENLQGRQAVNLKVEGLQKWQVDKLQALYQCRGKGTYLLIPTSNPEIWLVEDTWCQDNNIRFCLTDMERRFVCSAWHDRKTMEPLRTGRLYKKKTTSFKVPYKRTFRWHRSDGSYMKIKSVEEFAQSKRREELPSVYSSLLLSAVGSVDATLVLGTAQLMYWPKPSEKGSLLFDPSRIGLLARVSRSVNSVLLTDGRELTTDWYDLSVNYRQNPQGVFESNHIYTFLTYSSFSALSRTTTRVGGGIGFSFNWPDKFLGWNYPGQILTYIDFSFLPLDPAGDNRGIIVSSKANGIWLFSNNFFFTGDVEMRLLNFGLETENSVMRLQFGGGWSF